jgi:hypothetical protein
VQSLVNTVAAVWVPFVFPPSHSHVIWGIDVVQDPLCQFSCCFLLSEFPVFIHVRYQLHLQPTDVFCQLAFSSFFALHFVSAFTEVESLHTRGSSTAFEAVVPVKCSTFLRELSPNILQGLLHLCSTLS